MNPEKRAYNAAYNASHREEARAHKAAYRQAHREELRVRSAAYYQEHGEEILASQAVYRADHRDVILEKQRQKRAEFTEWLQILRTNNGCEDCETHEGRLDFHHVDPDIKGYSVSNMCRCSLDALEDELEKCVVECDACHAKRHVALRANARAGGVTLPDFDDETRMT